jgi:predicted nucleic acid-binding protein
VKVVVDASVVLKWLIEDRASEPDCERATDLMQAVVLGTVGIVQPVHWLLEVGAVLARRSPATAAADLERLHAMEWPVCDDSGVLRTACDLSITLGQHLFDTLYHAVALGTPGAVLVTADRRYLRAAQQRGRICALGEWHGSN